MSQVNHPSHYGGDTQYEAIKVIDDWGLGRGFAVGSAMKYICRAPHKGSEEVDLRKALWYLKHASYVSPVLSLWGRLRQVAEVFSRPKPETMPAIDVADAWGLRAELRDVLTRIARGDLHVASVVLEDYIVSRFGI